MAESILVTVVSMSLTERRASSGMDALESISVSVAFSSVSLVLMSSRYCCFFSASCLSWAIVISAILALFLRLESMIAAKSRAMTEPEMISMTVLRCLMASLSCLYLSSMNLVSASNLSMSSSPTMSEYFLSEA